jgi:hypothetical protein
MLREKIQGIAPLLNIPMQGEKWQHPGGVRSPGRDRRDGLERVVCFIRILIFSGPLFMRKIYS